MQIDTVKERRQEIIETYGRWTAGCIHLTDQVYTFEPPHWDSKLRRFVQIAADLTGQPLNKLRVLDLACLEGQYGIEFALHGADVVAIEGRKQSLEKARFAKDVLSLNNLKLVLGDVRDLDEADHGQFDVILCLGILYHLDTPDVMNFLESISKLCKKVTIIDTHVSPKDKVSYIWKTNTYWGDYVTEHDTEATREEKLVSAWSSLDNVRAFWFTRASLCNLLRHVGFTSVYECLNPYEFHNPNWPQPTEGDRHVVWKDRITLVAIKGQNQTLLSSPITNLTPEIDRPETPAYIENERCARTNGWFLRLWSRLSRLLPISWKRALKSVIR
jgi:2-polyprenyl-3-methyl-5-hydroxy-6-metoxy-1,4-benzoquinol methylase